MSIGGGSLGPGWGSSETLECGLGWAGQFLQESRHLSQAPDSKDIRSVDGWLDRSGKHYKHRLRRACLRLGSMLLNTGPGWSCEYLAH